MKDKAVVRKKIILGDREIFYELSRKPVKNINLRIHTDLRITISANNSVSLDKINNFILSKSDWILSALDKFERKKENTVNTDDFFYLWGEKFDITVISGNKNSIALSENEVIITQKDVSDANIKRRLINKLYISECNEKITALCEKVYNVCKINGLQFPVIKLRSMKSRWGSCNPKKGILTFNTALAHLPLSCSEYVVFHEFTHFLHPDHSKRFYMQLEAYMPNWKEQKRLLKEKGALFD